MKLKRVKQCAKCPWKKSVNPYDIPNGYCETKHKALSGTIANPDDPLSTLAGDLRVMACHETQDAHCIGWLHNQIGVGNNIGLRMQMMRCENIGKIRVVGEQHDNFSDTLPANKRI